MINNEVMSKISAYKQNHLLRYYNELTEEEKKIYDKQLNELDFKYLDVFNDRDKDRVKTDDVYEPIKAMKLEDIDSNREELEQIGMAALKKCKIGAVLLAGGQGTRLGFDKPKGMFNIGVNKEVYIFERIITNLLEVVDKTGYYVPLFIMTSEKNDADTRNFFEEKNYFGYDKEFIYFFTQSMAPSVDFDGKLLMEDKYKLSLSPNGNGGWFTSIVDSGLLNEIHSKGIEWLNVFAVDNVLQRIADPVFVGATLRSGCPSSAKVVKKASPEERVGVMCRRNGKPDIVEYYELTESMRNEKDEFGEPAYNYGVILNYMFRIKELIHINDNKLTEHMAEKKIPYIDAEGNFISPQQPNGYKFEKLILDMINMLDDCLVYEVVRDREFAPVKNKEGVDSIDTARELLKRNGVEI